MITSTVIQTLTLLLLLAIQGQNKTTYDALTYDDHYDEEYDYDEDGSGESGSGDSEEAILVLPKFTSPTTHQVVKIGDTFNITCSVAYLGEIHSQENN